MELPSWSPELRRDALGLLTTRHSTSPKLLAAPGPAEDQLNTAFVAALRAPDHGKLVPFRFVVIREDGLDRLARLFEDYGRRHGKCEEDLAMERARARQAPVVVAVIARIQAGTAVPDHEQWATIGGAITNVLNAVHFMGFGAKMLSGLRASDPEIARAFCLPGESLVGWISIGTSKVASQPKAAPPLDQVVSRF
jgi:nitroreductase